MIFVSMVPIACTLRVLIAVGTIEICLIDIVTIAAMNAFVCNGIVSYHFSSLVLGKVCI